MRRYEGILKSLLILSILSLLLVAPTHATKPAPANGNVELVALGTTADRTAGGVLIRSVCHDTYVWYGEEGTFQGTADWCASAVVNLNTGHATYKGVMTFSGRVKIGSDEWTGTFVMSSAGTFDEGLYLRGQWVILGGTDDLASLHGQGTVWGDLIRLYGAGFYSGQIHFEP